MVSQYTYRKTFGLSYQEYVNEPLDIYNTNMEIMSMVAKLEEYELKKAKRRGKM